MRKSKSSPICSTPPPPRDLACYESQKANRQKKTKFNKVALAQIRGPNLLQALQNPSPLLLLFLFSTFFFGFGPDLLPTAQALSFSSLSFSSASFRLLLKPKVEIPWVPNRKSFPVSPFFLKDDRLLRNIPRAQSNVDKLFLFAHIRKALDPMPSPLVPPRQRATSRLCSLPCSQYRFVSNSL